MKTTIIQTTTKTFDEARILLATRVNETYLLEPDEGKVLRNKITGQLFSAGLCVDKERKIKDYEEIDENKG
jgi:hypothetical protein